ncbi:MAG TPA: hypothetical protein VK829_03930 [Terriglobales bacterium]|jgi:hypothetical protein|nr:hypothetical protein [Terriglobales bacterium]
MKSKLITVLFMLSACALQAQKVNSFEGIDASQIMNPEHDVDPNGAVGTKQFVEWVNVAFQAYDKKTFAPVWSAPQSGTMAFRAARLSNCYSVGGDGVINFDRLANRWIVAMHTTGNNGYYYYCVAVSNTDDLSSSTLAWYAYSFPLNPWVGTNSRGQMYFPDWPKLGTWQDAYYVSFDLEDPSSGEEIGILACALDRTNMLTGNTPNPMQCFSDPSPIPSTGPVYLKHSLIPADVEGSNPPPAGRDEFLVSIQNPPNDRTSTTSDSINLWDFHVDWVNPANSSFTSVSLPVSTYTPGCYNPKNVLITQCVPEPSTASTHIKIDSVGDRLMPRMSYRNFGSYESFLVSHTIQTQTKPNSQTGIRWYELRGSGTPSVHQSGTITPGGIYLYRFMPSIAQDKVGNAAAGYNISGINAHPGIRASWWNLPNDTTPRELGILTGTADEENSWHWGDYTSMTVDPVDGCTFWYVTQYFAANEIGTSINWNTRISNFKISTCK